MWEYMKDKSTVEGIYTLMFGHMEEYITENGLEDVSLDPNKHSVTLNLLLNYNLIVYNMRQWHEAPM